MALPSSFISGISLGRHNSTLGFSTSSSPIRPSPIQAYRPSSSFSGSSIGGGRGGDQLRDASGKLLAADDTLFQANTLVFEWRVTGVKALEAEIAAAPSEDPSENELLRPGPVIGQGQYKIDCQVETPADRQTQSGTPTMLSPEENEAQATDESNELWLYVASLDVEVAARIMVGIKACDENIGSKHAPSEWLFQEWEDCFGFSRDAEFWRCQLPPISDLLKNPSVEAKDTFVLVIQVQTPSSSRAAPIEIRDCHYVPRALLTALESSLDNATTGDVMLITRERQKETPPASSIQHASRRSTGSTSATSSAPSFSTTSRDVRTRKRVIWAHKDVLMARSDYFDTMLGSGFAESVSNKHVHTINLEDMDFGTVYWLIKYIYTNSLEFDKTDDVRLAHRLANIKPSPFLAGPWEWEWQSGAFRSPGTSLAESLEGDLDSRTIASVSSASSAILGQGAQRSSTAGGRPSGGEGGMSSSGNFPQQRSMAVPRSPSTSASLHPSPPYSHRSRRGDFTGSTATASGSPCKPSSIPVPSSAAHVRGGGIPATSRSPTSHIPLPSRSPQQQQQSSRVSLQALAATASTTGSSASASSPPDPHAHPTTPPPPASALSIFHLASRYQLRALEELAMEHIMSSLEPKKAMRMLLACSFYEELHDLVQNFVVDNWVEISQLNEFEAVNNEVSAGLWGESGGRVLTSLFRRLHPPSSGLKFRSQG